MIKDTEALVRELQALKETSVMGQIGRVPIIDECIALVKKHDEAWSEQHYKELRNRGFRKKPEQEPRLELQAKDLLPLLRALVSDNEWIRDQLSTLCIEMCSGPAIIRIELNKLENDKQ